MESLQDILGKKKLVLPNEMQAIKDYVQRRYKTKCSIKEQRGAFIVSVPSSGLAATLQMARPEIIKTCNLGDKKLVIRNRR